MNEKFPNIKAGISLERNYFTNNHYAKANRKANNNSMDNHYKKNDNSLTINYNNISFEINSKINAPIVFQKNPMNNINIKKINNEKVKNKYNNLISTIYQQNLVKNYQTYNNPKIFMNKSREEKSYMNKKQAKANFSKNPVMKKEKLEVKNELNQEILSFLKQKEEKFCIDHISLVKY